MDNDKEIIECLEKLNDIIDSKIQEGYKIKPHILDLGVVGKKPFFRIDLEVIKPDSGE